MARYHGFSGLQMETRATRLRFETLLAATDAYLAAGHPLARLAAEELAARGFLPPTWKREPHGIYDIFVTPWSDRGVVIGQLASPSALKELIDRYRNSAGEIYLPYPKLLSGTGGATAVNVSCITFSSRRPRCPSMANRWSSSVSPSIVNNSTRSPLRPRDRVRPSRPSN